MASPSASRPPFYIRTKVLIIEKWITTVFIFYLIASLFIPDVHYDLIEFVYGG